MHVSYEYPNFIAQIRRYYIQDKGDEVNNVMIIIRNTFGLCQNNDSSTRTVTPAITNSVVEHTSQNHL